MIPPKSKLGNAQPIKIIMKSQLCNCCPANVYTYYATMVCNGEASELSQLMEVLKWIETKNCIIYYYMAYCIMNDEIQATGTISNVVTTYATTDSENSINLDDEIVRA